MEHTNEITGLLKEVELFQKTPEAVLRNLASHLAHHSYQPDQLIIRKGDDGNSLFVIASGSIKVHDGEQVVAMMQKGNFFGEISLLDAAPRSMSVSAVEKAELYSISREDFYKVFKDHPEVTQRIVSTLTRRLRNQNESIIQQLRMREEELSALVDERTAELKQKNTELEETLDHLKSTQAQLVQQEKLASLGQLTSGIAHELQNPLNFVTNFSSLTVELVDEIMSSQEAEEKQEIADTIKQNLEKINHHSKRAGGIVKGMLEHTRSGKGEKALTAINPLCDRIADLALQTIKANAPGFECNLVKSLDKNLPEIQVIPQELSRVLLNVLGNAFYAVKEKPDARVELITGLAEGAQGKQKLEIKICDNGTGIAEGIKPKIFDPFFTTKPTGFGSTGLGLSISFDIVKAHGGEMRFESKEGAGSTFVISLPV